MKSTRHTQKLLPLAPPAEILAAPLHLPQHHMLNKLTGSHAEVQTVGWLFWV